MCLSSLFCFHGNIGLQGIEATFPELPILLKPHIGLPERARPKAAYMLSTSDLAMYKAGALQHHHVLRNCVEGDWEGPRSEEHTSELQSHVNLVCRLLLEKKNQ